jgi:ABC-type branched-subunit amino acid transport system substrate-binding protein
MKSFKVGLLFSTSGPYAALGRSALDGALLALDEVNAEGRVALDAVVADPQGIPQEYERLAGEMVGHRDLCHIVGGITSWSRKDMIPVMERHGGLLWYPCPYEGFEISDHVVYLGACPNQHLLPLIDHVATRQVGKAFLVGSNYVWGWETLRVARERLARQGIEVTGERYIPLGATETGRLIEEIEASRPSLIVNSLIGPSNHAFMRALARLKDDGLDCLVVSANQTEADLAALGPAADGMLSIGAWFETQDGAAGADFRARIAARFGADYRASCNFTTAYVSVRLLAAGLAAVGNDDPRSVFEAVAGVEHDTALGRIEIDPVNRHTSLIPRLAVARNGTFEIISDPGTSVAPDPYLTRLAADPVIAPPAPKLRIVS